MLKQIAIAALSFTSLTACQKNIDNTINNTDNPATYREILNEKYGTDTAQKADVYLPANRNSNTTKVAVLLHGGAWLSGDKTDLTAYIRIVQSKYPELAIVNANYRLAGPAAQHPAQMTDIQKLFDYLESKHNEWHISNNFALGGVSAGAHLSLLYAYKYDVAKKVKVALSVVGPTYFLDPYYVNNTAYFPIIQNLVGKPLSDSASYREVSPAYVLSAGAPPTYMAYGGLDPLVPVSNATMLNQKLTTLNIPHQYDFFPNEGHEFQLSTYDTVARKMVAFLKQYQ